MFINYGDKMYENLWIVEQINRYFYNWNKKKLRRRVEIDDLRKFKYQINNNHSVNLVATNSYYGHVFQLKKYAGIDDDVAVKCTIEHGASMDPFLCEQEFSHTNRIVLTMGEYRKKIIEQSTNKLAIPIGPYIRYAQDYYDEEKFNKIKACWGKVLLVFPVHGMANCNIVFDVNFFISQIEDVKKNFDTVVVCLYIDDIKRYAKFYKNKGYKVVCAGACNDVNNLGRQKTILRLSDAVIGNGFTSGIVYAIALDKPAYIIDVDISHDNKNNTILNVEQIFHAGDENLEQFKKISNSSNFDNLQKQKEWGEYFWGFSKFKSREEMRELLLGRIIN